MKLYNASRMYSAYIPSGQYGKAFIKECTRLLLEYVERSSLECVAVHRQRKTTVSGRNHSGDLLAMAMQWNLQLD